MAIKNVPSTSMQSQSNERGKNYLEYYSKRSISYHTLSHIAYRLKSLSNRIFHYHEIQELKNSSCPKCRITFQKYTCFGSPFFPLIVVTIIWPASVPFPSTIVVSISCKKIYINFKYSTHITNIGRSLDINQGKRTKGRWQMRRRRQVILPCHP